jgi:PadR family transcriptional regulator PadR
MADPPAELLKGTLDLLILRTLDLAPRHGAAIAERLAQTSRGTFQVKAGSLFPALHRLEQDGSLRGVWEMSADGRRVKTYTLTRAGRRQLATEKANWDRIAVAMTRVLET